MGNYLKVYSQLTPQELRQLHYKELYKKLQPQWDDALILLCKLFKPLIRPNLTVLDAGCGRGNIVIDEYRKDIKSAIGIDLTRESTSKNVCLDKVVIANLEHTPFPKNSFDVVLSLWTIEHLKNPRKVFSEIHRVLKPKGIFLFVTPYKFFYMIIAKRIIGEKVTRFLLKHLYGRSAQDHFYTWYKANTPATLLTLLGQVGFRHQALFLNPDPSYLALNNFLFGTAVLLEKFSRFIPFNLTKVHIIGAFVKAAP